MPEVRRKFDADFRAGAVRIVKESGERPGALSEDERAELARLRREYAELAWWWVRGTGTAVSLLRCAVSTGPTCCVYRRSSAASPGGGRSTRSVGCP